MSRLISACALLLSIAMASCTSQTAPQARTQDIRPIATITATATVTVSPAALIAPSPTLSVLAEKHVAPRIALSQYRISLKCVSKGKRASGAAFAGTPETKSIDAIHGRKITYSFAWHRDEPSTDPVVSSTKDCTMRSIRETDGSEPRLQVTLGCEGGQMFESGSKPVATSAIERTWRRLAGMTTPFVHTMAAPKYDGQISETDDCTITVV